MTADTSIAEYTLPRRHQSNRPIQSSGLSLTPLATGIWDY
jgi:hypothetical protein